MIVELFAVSAIKLLWLLSQRSDFRFSDLFSETTFLSLNSVSTETELYIMSCDLNGALFFQKKSSLFVIDKENIYVLFVCKVYQQIINC